MQTFNIFPVTYHKAVKAKLILQNIGQQILIAVGWNPVNLRGIHHNRLHTGLHGSSKGWQENVAHHAFRNPRRGAVTSVYRHTVTQIVLHAGRNTVISGHTVIFAFHAVDIRAPHNSHGVRVFSIRFPKARPERHTSHTQHGIKIPGNTGSTYFFGGNMGAFFNKFRVPRCGHSNALREKRGVLGVVGAMNGINTI